MEPYLPEVEAMMKELYQTLSEKDKRRYAAIEVLKLGHGEQSYLAQLLKCSQNTIAEDKKELEDLPEESVHERRIRRPGGGRKRYEQTHPDIDEQFLAVMADHTAGAPMDEQIRWTNLSRQEIAERLSKQHGVQVSVTVIKQLLNKHDDRQRKAQKK